MLFYYVAYFTSNIVQKILKVINAIICKVIKGIITEILNLNKLLDKIQYKNTVL